MELIDVLNDAKAITKSDGNTARKLGVSDQAISNWRTGRNTPNNTQCARLAEITGHDLGTVIALAERRRAKTADDVAMWERITRKLTATAGTALGALLVAGMIAAPNEAHAAFDKTSVNSAGNTHYRALRRVLRWLRARHARTDGTPLMRALRGA